METLLEGLGIACAILSVFAGGALLVWVMDRTGRP